MIDLEEWKKITSDPRPEVNALFKRKELHLADFHEDPAVWHLQAMVYGVLRELDDAFSRFEWDRDNPDRDGKSEYFHWQAVANHTFSLGLLRAIREHADEITPLLAARKSHEQLIRSQVAQAIRAELVCDCDSNARERATWDADGNWDYEAYQKLLASPDFHRTCDIAESAARIAEAHV